VPEQVEALELQVRDERDAELSDERVEGPQRVVVGVSLRPQPSWS